ncbi:topoisomerase 3-alpha isoform X2 [Rhodnius prolixus]|uniref:topoisomerase 3-alpha isoform X2 n=1 Tax=Rhodnius prolixus TaxID=13249 RepID=UPI003D189A62
MFLKVKWIIFILRYASSEARATSGIKPTMKVLNVAEKNDAAKNISYFLSNGHSRRREGFSPYNKIYEFDYPVFGQNCSMIMTSVSGHLLNYEFSSNFRKWTCCSPEELFDAPVQKFCSQEYLNIKKTLENEAKSCDKLIIWTDCDREGENIGFEVIDTCQKINSRLDIYRAIFSEITGPSIKRAVQNLSRPNKNISNAVEVRQELDLRIGASFTRFQTLRLQKVFPVLADHLLSYGSCQFPTLGFVVERYLEREKFIAEPFWRIKDETTVAFRWSRDKLFDEAICIALLDRCKENPLAKILKVEGKPKSKWRPLPLDTTEMEKMASRKLRITAKEALKIAEKLYTQGFISYPRTETNIFPSSLNLNSLVEMQTDHPNWGGFARNILQDGANPRQGKKSDQSHPPIHPIKYTNSLQGNEAKMYEFIVRHFLACVSKDAKGHETNVLIEINGEEFQASGLMILERNYLDVYPYENWNSKNIHYYEVGQTFHPTILDIEESQTSPPNLLTEADLIALMEKHGIGTDATHAEHIETIKTRSYVGLEGNYFVPSAIGMGLVEGYDTMGFAMSKPHLRAELEADLKRICDGVRRPEDVLREQIDKYRNLFQQAKLQVNKIDEAIGKYIQATAIPLNPENDPLNVRSQQAERIFPCKLCGLSMSLKSNQTSKYISCSGFPNCKAAIWLPAKVLAVNISNETCEMCGPNVRKLEFKFTRGSMMPYYPDVYVGCLNGCDHDFIEMLDIRLPKLNNSSGYASQQSTGSSANNEHSSRFSFNSTTSQRTSSSPRISSFNTLSNITNARIFSPNITDDSVQCFCSLPAKKLTVKKDGPNKGKIFFACQKNSNEKCDFFLWEEALSNQLQPQQDRSRERNRGSHFGRGRGSRRGNNSFRALGSNHSATRRCGLCSQTGHTRRNCPQNQD